MAARNVIFVMDDSEVVLEVLSEVLGGAGYVVRAAVNLGALEAHLSRGAPDLVVLDVQMPEMFGDDVAQVLRWVRKIEAPVILFSSMPRASLEARVRDAGLQGYVGKDDGAGALLAKVRELLPPG
jgi:CheY-like chemotaxis protein